MEISKEIIEAMAEAVGSEQLIECLSTAFEEENLKSVEAVALLFREKMTSDTPWEIEAWSPEIETDQWEPETDSEQVGEYYLTFESTLYANGSEEIFSWMREFSGKYVNGEWTCVERTPEVDEMPETKAMFLKVIQLSMPKLEFPGPDLEEIDYSTDREPLTELVKRADVIVSHHTIKRWSDPLTLWFSPEGRLAFSYPGEVHAMIFEEETPELLAERWDGDESITDASMEDSLLAHRFLRVIVPPFDESESGLRVDGPSEYWQKLSEAWIQEGETLDKYDLNETQEHAQRTRHRL